MRSLDYYGYDRNTYNDCLGQIRSTNLKHITILNTWFLVIAMAFLGIRVYDSVSVESIFRKVNLNGMDRVGMGPFWFFAVAALFLEVYVILCHYRPKLNIHILPYFNIVMISLFSIFCSIAQPSKQATMFLVVLVLLSVSYIDTFFRMGFVFLALSGLFVMTSMKGINSLHIIPKPVSIANEDMFNLLVCLSLSLVLHYTMQHTRMHQYVTYQSNLQITQELSIKSSFDALTSLLNRGRFMSMAGEVLRGAADEYVAICVLDLDGFKQINDKLGHQMGDKAIQLAGETITETLGIDLSEKWSFPERAVRDHLSFAGRLGGDEFIVLMRGVNSEDEVRTILQRMLDSLNGVRFGELNGIHASFGVTRVSGSDRDIDKAYSRADEALYESKRAGKNQIRFNNPKS